MFASWGLRLFTKWPDAYVIAILLYAVNRSGALGEEWCRLDDISKGGWDLEGIDNDRADVEARTAQHADAEAGGGRLGRGGHVNNANDGR